MIPLYRPESAAASTLYRVIICINKFPTIPQHLQRRSQVSQRLPRVQSVTRCLLLRDPDLLIHFCRPVPEYLPRVPILHFMQIANRRPLLQILQGFVHLVCAIAHELLLLVVLCLMQRPARPRRLLQIRQISLYPSRLVPPQGQGCLEGRLNLVRIKILFSSWYTAR